MSPASDPEAREFAARFGALLEWVQFEQTRARERNEVVALVGDFLGEGASERSVVTRSLPVFEHVNLQAALDAWAREPGRGVAVHGISIPPHHGSVNLQQLLTGEAMTPIRLSAPPLVDLPNDHCPRCLARSRPWLSCSLPRSRATSSMERAWRPTARSPDRLGAISESRGIIDRVCRGGVWGGTEPAGAPLARLPPGVACAAALPGRAAWAWLDCWGLSAGRKCGDAPRAILRPQTPQR